ncbi:MAG: hypothetical protein GY852_05630 [bacterium]|nr:hypothetical protein [bacterium]
MRKLWPELFVLGLFLLGDFLWDGLASAVAGAGAGILAFGILLLFKRKKPVLILEGLLFGGVTAVGEFVNYPGGTLILMELIFGVVLTASSLLGRDIISGITGGLGKGLFSLEQSGILSLTLGSVLLIHSVLSTLLALTGLLNWWVGGALFALIYTVALKQSRAGMKKAELDSLPQLIEEGELFRLRAGGTTLGSVHLTVEGTSQGIIEIAALDGSSYKFLDFLETACKRRGLRTISVDCWPLDEIELEMRGYSFAKGLWQKRLP